MRRPTFLHDDRNEPCVGGSGSDQAGEHARPEPRVQIIDVGLDQHCRLSEIVFRLRDSFTDEYPSQVRATGRISAAGASPGSQQGEHRQVFAPLGQVLTPMPCPLEW